MLALKGFERDEQILRADEAATLLRAHLRLVHDCGGLPERQLVHVLGQLDEIGRQIGGWQRRLQSDRVTPRHR